MNMFSVPTFNPPLYWPLFSSPGASCPATVSPHNSKPQPREIAIRKNFTGPTSTPSYLFFADSIGASIVLSRARKSNRYPRPFSFNFPFLFAIFCRMVRLCPALSTSTTTPTPTTTPTSIATSASKPTARISARPVGLPPNGAATLECGSPFVAFTVFHHTPFYQRATVILVGAPPACVFSLPPGGRERVGLLFSVFDFLFSDLGN